MGQIEYFGHTFNWRTHKNEAGAFEAIAGNDGTEVIVALCVNRSAAYRAAKAGAMEMLEIWRRVVIFDAMRKRHERRFKKFAADRLSILREPLRQDRSPAALWRKAYVG